VSQRPLDQRVLTGHGDRAVLDALQRITDAALAFLPEEELLQELLQRISDIMAVDTVAILLLEDDTLHARAAKGIEEEVEQDVRIPLGRGFAGRIAAERRSIAITDVDHADILNPILREKGIQSLLGVPLLVQGRVTGVLHVGSLTPREFSADERDLLQLAGDRAALAIEQARLLLHERIARESAEAATRRLESLQRITDAALTYLPEEELLQELLQRVSDILAVDTVAILLLEGDAVHARAAKGIEEEVEQGVRIPLGRGFAGRIAAERRPIAITDVDHADILNPILREKGIQSLLGVPLLVQGRVIGVLHVGSLTPREFSADERDLLQLAGDRAALAIEQARLYEQRRVAEVLQRRLLPGELGSVLGIEAAARYLPASGGSLGGDWYDIFQLPGGRVCVAVGDVVGRGVEAAAVMAQLRTAVRAYAADGHAPAAVVDRVNSLMLSLGPLAMTTLVLLVIDPAAETLEVVGAGHPPALVVDPSGAAAFVWPPGGVPLGVTAAAVYTSETHRLPTGSTVLAYTDGLVERRDQSIDVGLERLRRVAEGARDIEVMCQAIVDQLVSEAPGDDVALVAARVPPLGDHLSTRWTATPDSLAPIRYLLRRWLLGRGAGEDEAYDIIVATQEACANAIEHAYGPGFAEFVLELTFADGRVTIAVADRGHWRAPRGDDRGRGLPLMRELMDTVDVSPAEGGTAVTLARALGRPPA
jgi:GAF domain-containing protein/anti-sigma regulatory factor (Ser/Thr protein kinase)